MIAKRYNDNGKAVLALNSLQKAIIAQINTKVSEGIYEFEQVPCVTCGSEEVEPLSCKDRYGLSLSVGICTSCGLVQTNPRMVQSAYLSFYNTEYRKLYLGEQEVKDSFFRRRYDKGRMIHHYLKEQGFQPYLTSGMRTFEVGCSAGGILKYFADCGFDTYGIDLDSEYVQYGKDTHGLNIDTRFVHEVSPEYRADLIIYSHVLEHILSPNTELSAIRRILSDQGLLYIEVPGIRNLYRNYEMDFLKYLQNAHVYHFSLQTLKVLLENNGFELLVGDESVCAVFRRRREDIRTGSRGQSLQSSNDYAETMKYLRRMELLRHFYPLSPLSLQAKFKKIVLSLLKTLCLYRVCRNVLQRLKSA